jgi:IS30 family transposase
MDRAPSTIMCELKRNTGSQVGYQPAYADKQAKSRRWKGSRLLRDPDLQKKGFLPAHARLVATCQIARYSLWKIRFKRVGMRRVLTKPIHPMRAAQLGNAKHL